MKKDENSSEKIPQIWYEKKKNVTKRRSTNARRLGVKRGKAYREK